MNFTHDLLPMIICLSIPAGWILILHLIQTCNSLKKRSSPLDEMVLGAPGQSLVKKIDGHDQDIGLNMVFSVSVPLLLYSSYASHLYFSQHTITTSVALILAGSGTAATFYYIVKILKLLKKRRQLRLEYESAIAVGQQLNQLMLEGYYVYHDFPAGRFHIDHLVVGRSGIFAVETTARSKSKSGGGLQDATVEYNGKMLTFPDGDDFKIIEQAERQAAWLSEWIVNAIGEPVAARAIVALPSWYVKRTSAEGISAVNPEQIPSLFKHIKPRPLSEDMIARIVKYLEQKRHAAGPGSKEYEIKKTPVYDPVSDISLRVETLQ